MSTATHQPTKHDSQHEPDGDVFAARIFSLGAAGLCAVIWLMILVGDWW